jgi:hypothetical protein
MTLKMTNHGLRHRCFFKYIVTAHGDLAQDHVPGLSCALNGPPLYTLRGLQCVILTDTLTIISYTVIQSMTEGQELGFLNLGVDKANVFWWTMLRLWGIRMY